MVRSDARDNRERILAAARAALTEDGHTSMNQVAQRAGVGAGTLYRNFPTREALLLGVYQDEVARIVELVPELLATMPAVDALRRWTTELVAAMRRKHGLGDALSAGAHQAISERTHGPVLAAITALLDAGKAAGAVRTDADPGDFLQFTGALWRADAGPEDRSPRMLALLLDGLRPAADR
ncbi:TetR/AcrR family transcriptional regulator [Nakamurella endophytica]|uniref:TetR family transcriptional regulator n=1 Tax=Nakamurella endophytica TaxID=1748367 RepID=A0A917SUP8_9ACTN|nr:TetR/AcrR family transcriptional regulator [Nakamurella endophytica]GGL98504.1 TetR family transcriptional regulator [Nakamurella endophytica]